METMYFNDIKGNSFELKEKYLAWRDEKDECGFLTHVDYIDEVNIGPGEEGKSCIQLFLVDQEKDKRYEYYFEFAGENDASIMAHAVLGRKNM